MTTTTDFTDKAQNNYSESLAIAVRNARLRLHLTQAEAAELAGVAIHTISDIECARGNPTLAVFGGLIERLRIDPRIIFSPNKPSEDPISYSAHQLLNECSSSELEFVVPIASKVLDTLRSSQYKEITSDN